MNHLICLFCMFSWWWGKKLPQPKENSGLGPTSKSRAVDVTHFQRLNHQNFLGTTLRMSHCLEVCVCALTRKRGFTWLAHLFVSKFYFPELSQLSSTQGFCLNRQISKEALIKPRLFIFYSGWNAVLHLLAELTVPRNTM